MTDGRLEFEEGDVFACSIIGYNIIANANGSIHTNITCAIT